jgi:two-component system cell cycle sensor histidine kinase PleC
MVYVRTEVTHLKEQEQRLRRTIAELEESRTQLHDMTIAWRDLSEQHRAERFRAEAANLAKSDFLANMSHELRTPLNSIIGFSEIMTKEILGPIGKPKYLEYAADIHDSGTHLLSLINDLLDLAKIEAGKLELQEEDVDLAEIVETSVHLLRERALKAEVALETMCEPKLPWLRVDQRKVRQILFNLLANAVKFTPAGGRATVRASANPEGGVTLAVADTGIGIPPDRIESVLEPFIQVENVLTRTHAGTGLGLALCKSLAEAHGATMTLTSELGCGTTVTIAFPAARSLKQIPARIPAA